MFVGARNAPSAFDLVNFGIGVIGLIVTFVGFWIAIVQIRKTKSAAEAAARAAKVGSVRIRYNQLLMVVPQMQNLELEIDSAIQQSDSYAVERALLRWRQLAASSHGILGQMGESYKEIVEGIEKTRGTAITVKGRLSAPDATKPVATVTLGVRKEISTMNDRLASIVGYLATELPEDEVNQV